MEGKKTSKSKSFSFKTLMETEFKTLGLSAEWLAFLGEVERNFSMIVYGKSGCGKTSLVLRLCKELVKHGKVYFNSCEIGKKKSLQDLVKAANMTEGMTEEEIDQLEHKLFFSSGDTVKEMIEKLKTNNAWFVVIDSVQYAKLTYRQWLRIKKMFPRKAFIFISHESGESPEGAYAKKIEYDVEIKVRMVDGLATSRSRYGGTNPFYRIFEKKEEKKDKKALQVSWKTGTIFEKQADN